MQKFYLTFVICFAVGLTTVHAQQNDAPDLITPPDIEEKVTPGKVITHDKKEDSVVDMPIIDLPEEAKILVWWPETDYYYNMPNAFNGKKLESGEGRK